MLSLAQPEPKLLKIFQLPEPSLSKKRRWAPAIAASYNPNAA